MSDSSESARAATSASLGGRSGHAGLEHLLTVRELSAYLGVPVATIYDWRVDGRGPRAIRIGRHLRFPVGDVRAWLAGLRETGPRDASRPGR